ncbi:MAG: CDP-diacylglycerol--glycerol-3-phosphate 3-phosphatidyltransferase [Verrucomicrobia bacterium]|nr:CDP-diacylglycerol--glycerol-3-phosphate 3-phosphatidyltransferase [Verrucomicrobiota bacterium]MBU4286204.1 CDP-diacylglycerol--glycerol-3-phosphate 3-phosphatidyltransferase [Verrucomicrobiota bacterium]MBU4366661.1 CDP-diacylglycerol--glycerol-3-phosphate 3-phosphatidyltransferase [Verrucomicrobiota bacterium]
MNLANQLTVSRFGMAFVLTIFLTLPIPFGKTIGFFIFLMAALTDYWDGRLARRTGTVTAFGQLMDPLVDKVLICAAFVSFVAIHQIVPAWIVIIILTREFMVTGLRLLAAGQGRVIPASRWGKHKTVWQMGVISIILIGLAAREDLLPLLLTGEALPTFLNLYYDRYFHYVTFWLSALVAVLTVFSGSVYFWQCRQLVRKAK